MATNSKNAKHGNAAGSGTDATAKAAKAAKSTKSANFAKSAKSAKSAKAANSAKSTKLDKTATATEDAKSTKSTKSTKGSKGSKGSKGTKDTQSAKDSKDTQSAKGTKGGNGTPGKNPTSTTSSKVGKDAKTGKKAAGWTAESSNLLRVREGFRLDAVDARSTPGFTGNKADAEAAGDAAAKALSHLQELLFANSREGDPRKILLILQGMDTSGKGGIVRHVVGAVDPQGVSHVAFKAPTPAELRHDFLWRIRRQLPTAGLIGVFDRSHYEDVLIGRVRQLAKPEKIEERYELINAFEQEIVDDNTTVIKVMLHISADEQKQRLLERLDRPDKYWKFNPGDIDERMLWPDYQAAYQTALERTSTAAVPWHVVPADRKWYARLAVRELLVEALSAMDLTWPPADFDVDAERARLAAS